ncbi:MAG: Yip1 family protein [Bacteroidota bacterium]
MEEFNEQEPTNESNSIEEEEELTHTDKMVGVFTEPTNTFTEISQFPAKTADWIVPLLIFIVLVNLSTILMQTNPQIKYSMVEKQMEVVQKSLDDAVKSGAMTQEQADSRSEAIREQFESGGAAMMIPQIVGTVIGVFIFFFIVSGYFFAISKFGLKGTGTYKDAMVAYGLPLYVAMIQVIFTVILAMLMNKIITDTSIVNFIDVDKTQLLGFLMSKIDPFSIWFYAVVGVGFAKMFKSDSIGKYIGMVIGSWLIFSIIFFFIGKAVPILNFMNQ